MTANFKCNTHMLISRVREDMMQLGWKVHQRLRDRRELLLWEV
jgi:hypothetical protein